MKQKEKTFYFYTENASIKIATVLLTDENLVSYSNKKKDNIRILEFRKLILSFLYQTSLKFRDKQEYMKFILN